MAPVPAWAAKSHLQLAQNNFCPSVCVPVYGDAFGEAIVKEEDPDTGQLGDWAGCYNLHTAILQDFNHTGPAPESLLPSNKDHGSWRESEKQKLNHMPIVLLHSGDEWHVMYSQSRCLGGKVPTNY